MVWWDSLPWLIGQVLTLPVCIVTFTLENIYGLQQCSYIMSPRFLPHQHGNHVWVVKVHKQIVTCTAFYSYLYFRCIILILKWCTGIHYPKQSEHVVIIKFLFQIDTSNTVNKCQSNSAFRMTFDKKIIPLWNIYKHYIITVGILCTFYHFDIVNNNNVQVVMKQCQS